MLTQGQKLPLACVLYCLSSAPPNPRCSIPGVAEMLRTGAGFLPDSLRYIWTATFVKLMNNECIAIGNLVHITAY